MEYSVNGLRRELSRELRRLRHHLNYELEEGAVEFADEIKESFNELACLSNSFNCVSVKGLKYFDDLSEEKEVELFD